jgi:hypothetical protein
VGKWKNAEEGKGPVEEKIIPKTSHNLDVEVDIANRVGKWKSAEEGKGPVEDRPVKKTTADLPVEVDMQNRLGKWKSAEEGKGEERIIQKTVSDLPVEVDIGNRLGKWKSAEEGKGAVEERVIQKTTADLPVEVDMQNRLGIWKSNEEPKDEAPSGPRKAPITITVANKDGVIEGVVSPRVRERMSDYTKVAEGEAKVAGRNAVEEVGEAPKLKDRVNVYNKAAEDRPPQKEAVVVPYEDGYQAPAPPQENAETVPARREPVKVEGASSLKDRLSNWNEATAEKPVPKTAIDLPED